MIVTLRRTFASSRMTFGEMSMGSVQCSTLEPPMPLFQSRGETAIPEGQYPMLLDGENIVVDGVPNRSSIVLGREIVYGLSTRDAVVLKQKEAHEIFHNPIAAAIKRGDDVMLDVFNPR
jgi:hypothetical protein